MGPTGEEKKGAGGVFSGNSFNNSAVSLDKTLLPFRGENKASLQPGLTELHFKSSPNPALLRRPFSPAPYRCNNCNVPIKQLRQGPDIVRGPRSDASSVARALLSYWGPQMKGEVSHTVVASRFIQLRSHLHFLKNIKVAQWQS